MGLNEGHVLACRCLQFGLGAHGHFGADLVLQIGVEPLVGFNSGLSLGR